MPTRPLVALLLVAAAASAAGCAGAGGTIGPAGSGGGAGTGMATGNGGTGGTGAVGGGVVLTPPPPDLPEAKPCTAAGTPGPRQLRRLTAAELNATVRDLFRDPNAPAANLFSDPPTLGFNVDSKALLIQDLVGEALKEYAESTARWAVTNRLSQISPCQTKDSACGRQFIGAFGQRAFRAPLPAARVDAYEAIFTAESTFADAAEAVIAAMLQSPHFLYRTELGPATSGPGSTVTLTPHEVAANLSYFLTGSIPDDALMQAADAAASSGSPLNIDSHLNRLLSDPRAADTVMRFATGWLGLGRLSVAKDAAFYTLTDQMRADMLGETRAFFVDTFNTGGTLATLLTANYTFLNRNMATHYGFPTGSLSDQYTKVTFGAGGMRDAGLLAQAAILTGHATARTSSPTQRGKLVRERFLCQTLPPPPPGVDTMLDPPAPNQSTRQVYEQHTSTPGNCSSCHQFIDSVGYAFENYDGIGRHRTTDNNVAVNTTGQVLVFGHQTSPQFDFSNTNQLVTWLASNDEVRHCLVRYWSYYAYGNASWAQDACTYSAIEQEAAASNYSLKGVVTGIVHAPHFSRRTGDQ